MASMTMKIEVERESGGGDNNERRWRSTCKNLTTIRKLFPSPHFRSFSAVSNDDRQRRFSAFEKNSMAFVALSGAAGGRPTFFEMVAAERLMPSLKSAAAYSLSVRKNCGVGNGFRRRMPHRR